MEISQGIEHFVNYQRLNVKEIHSGTMNPFSAGFSKISEI